MIFLWGMFCRLRIRRRRASIGVGTQFGFEHPRSLLTEEDPQVSSQPSLPSQTPLRSLRQRRRPRLRGRLPRILLPPIPRNSQPQFRPVRAIPKLFFKNQPQFRNSRRERSHFKISLRRPGSWYVFIPPKVFGRGIFITFL